MEVKDISQIANRTMQFHDVLQMPSLDDPAPKGTAKFNDVRSVESRSGSIGKTSKRGF